MTAQNEENGLHAQIMNLPCMPDESAGINHALAFKMGHKQARHAAAELAQAATAQGEQERKQLQESLALRWETTKRSSKTIVELREQLSESQKREAELQERVKELEVSAARYEYLREHYADWIKGSICDDLGYKMSAFDEEIDAHMRAHLTNTKE